MKTDNKMQLAITEALADRELTDSVNIFFNKAVLNHNIFLMSEWILTFTEYGEDNDMNDEDLRRILDDIAALARMQKQLIEMRDVLEETVYKQTDYMLH